MTSIDNKRVSESLLDGYYLVQCCIDGDICHANCGAGCLRQKWCYPLGSADGYLNEDWSRKVTMKLNNRGCYEQDI